MASCATYSFSGIGANCKGSRGGVVKAWIAPHTADLITKSNTGDITTYKLKDTTTFKEFSFRKGTSSFTSTLNIDSANGVNYVSTEINLVFHRMSASKRVEMNSLALANMVVVVKDGNGKYWLFGIDEAVVASAGEGSTGVAATDGNKYSITLLDEFSEWPYELTDSANITALDAIATDPEVD